MILTEIRPKKRIKLTVEQFKYVRDNKGVDSAILAEHLGVSFNSITHNKYLVKQLEKPRPPRNFFDYDQYFKEITTI